MLKKEEAPEHWEDILQEYNDLIHTEKSTNLFDLVKKINFAAAKLCFVGEATKYMKEFGWDKEFADYLVQYGFDYIEESTGEELLRQIYAVEIESKTIIVLLNQYNAEYKRKFPEGADTEELEEMDYLKELAILSKFIGHRIVSDEIYVIEFCAIVNLFIEHNKERKNGLSDQLI